MEIDAAKYNTIKQRLFTVFNLLAPDGNSQRKYAAMVHDMEDKNERHETIIAAMVATIHDGLHYGNWIT